MECKKEANLKDCTCTYPDCPRKGICCECVAHHRKNGEIPGCFFCEKAEAGFDRSIKAFVQDKE